MKLFCCQAKICSVVLELVEPDGRDGDHNFFDRPDDAAADRDDDGRTRHLLHLRHLLVPQDPHLRRRQQVPGTVGHHDGQNGHQHDLLRGAVAGGAHVVRRGAPGHPLPAQPVQLAAAQGRCLPTILHVVW